MEKGTWLAALFGIVANIILMIDPSVALPQDKRVVCYVYTNDVENLDIDFCTDLVVSFCYFGPTDDVYSENTLIWHGMTAISSRERLINMAGNKRILLGVGGYGDEIREGFENLVKKGKAGIAIATLKNIVEEKGYDGIDIDWEFPENGQDFENFMTAVFGEFGDKIVSIAVNGWHVSQNHYNLGNIHSNLDYVNLMDYDYNYNNPALPNSPINEIKKDCEKIVGSGVDISKINVLLPYYTRYGNNPDDTFNWGEVRDDVYCILSGNTTYGWDKKSLERKFKGIDWPSPEVPVASQFYVVDPYSMYRKIKYLTNENRIKGGLLKKGGNVGGVGIWQLGLEDFDPSSYFEMEQAILSGIGNQDYAWPENQLPPHIDSIDPPGGAIGLKITVMGNGFGVSKGSVIFSGGKKASIESWKCNKIVCFVPKGALTGDVAVVTKSGRSNGYFFTCLSENPIMSGGWAGNWNSDYGDSGGLSLILSQSGNNLSGTMTLTGTVIGTVSASFHGTLSGNSYTLTCNFQYAGATYTIMLEGTVSYDQRTMTGNYTVTGPFLDDSGAFSISKTG